MKGCMNCGNISCGNNKKRESAGCGRWISPEDKIAELEKENERLTVDYETLKLHDEEEIGMLKSENAELKDKLGDFQMQKAGEKSDLVWKLKTANEQKADQLTKAREIILRLYNAGRDVLMCRAEEKAYDNLSNAINDKSIVQFLEEIKI